jgi:diguanylate cyclase (GGDEF)-like protein/PAS domain S-box-containing protein
MLLQDDSSDDRRRGELMSLLSGSSVARTEDLDRLAAALDDSTVQIIEIPGGSSSGDPFTALVDAGRAIAGALSPEAVRQAVQRHAVTVLEAHRCQVVDVRDGEVLPTGDGTLGGVGEHTALLAAAAAERREVTVSELPPGQGRGSALCAPIVRSGRVVACCYAVFDEPAAAADPERQRLATLLAALAGATLEHVAGSEAHFRALVRNSHDLTIVTDPTGRALYVSPSITRILGYAPGDFTQLDGRLVHADDAAAVVDAFRLCRFSPATRPNVELRVRHRDGSWRWLELRLTNLLADDSIRGIVFNFRDATDRKAAELALAAATEQLRLSFENAPIGMALTGLEGDRAGVLMRVNQALADMLGRSRQELQGANIGGLSHPDDRAADEAAQQRFQQGLATSYSADKRYRHYDGRWIWVHLQANLVAAEVASERYVINQLLDVTEQREAEEHLTFLALHDPLTGLANRRLLLDRLTMAMARATRTGRRVGVLYLDLDGFKAVNDSWGHEQGDLLLRQAATRLLGLVRESDTLARLGGDEFVLVADDLGGASDAVGIAARILDTFDQPFELGGQVRVTLSTSVGVSLAAAGDNPKTVLHQADVAMYQAKQQGRRCFRVCDDQR